MKDDGIHISMREIYDIIVDTSKRLERLEERIHSYHDVDKKSSDALKAADEALKLSRVLTTGRMVAQGHCGSSHPSSC